MHNLTSKMNRALNYWTTFWLFLQQASHLLGDKHRREHYIMHCVVTSAFAQFAYLLDHEWDLLYEAVSLSLSVCVCVCVCA